MKLKKLIIFITIIIVVISATIISASAYNTSVPANPDGYPYFICFNREPTQDWYIYSAHPFTINESTYPVPLSIDTIAGGYRTYASNNGGAWSPSAYGTTSYSMAEIYNYTNNANYSIAEYEYSSAEIVYPLQDGTYTEYPDIIINQIGSFDLSNIEIYIYLTINSQSYAYRVDDGAIVISEGQANISSTNLPYADTGSVRIELVDMTDSSTLDEIEFQIDMTVSSAIVKGIITNQTYDNPPASVTVEKRNYPNAVTLFINDIKYKSYYDISKIYLLESDWTKKLIIGTNNIRLHDDVLDTDIQDFNFNIIRGSVDVNGNYIPPEGASVSQFGDEPVKPGAGASITEWIIYIGDSIAFILSIFFNAVKSFASSIADMLSSLFSIITPVLGFMQIMFASLPSQIAVGLYALFTLSCVLAILKMIKG